MGSNIEIQVICPMQILLHFNMQICQTDNQARNTLENQDLLQIQRKYEMLHYLEGTSHLLVEKKPNRCIGYLLITITPFNILLSQSATENQQFTSYEVLWPASDFCISTLTVTE